MRIIFEFRRYFGVPPQGSWCTPLPTRTNQEIHHQLSVGYLTPADEFSGKGSLRILAARRQHLTRPHGRSNQNAITYHALTFHLGIPRGIGKIMISAVMAEPPISYRTAHIVLMSIAFVLLLPLAAFIAHFAKAYKKRWVPYHAILNTATFILVAVAFAFGVYFAENDYTRPGKNTRTRVIIAHAWIGTFITFFITVQFLLGIGAHVYHDHRAVKDPSKKGRPTVPGIVHRWLGRVTFLLAVVNISLGMAYVGAATVWIVLFCVWGGLVILLWLVWSAFAWHEKEEKRLKEEKTQMETASLKPTSR
ncbi:hypothetical protein PROFUN_08760 [Planoprotostelium fungivorum]|uniref:Cytochrome b561 domain-containing protein n=1 Tax=Planoprotostelium fungivorum TaxID=1890364 RepID=A0A2P6ND48_9EUKA|nr:hypothetical protein PROFUN_08760 [Planoprotostelium fungivorum]